MSERRLTPPPWWQLWANPLLHRFCRARLRSGPLSAWLLVVLIAGWFIVLFLPAAHRKFDLLQKERVDKSVQLSMSQKVSKSTKGSGQVRDALDVLMKDFLAKVKQSTILQNRLSDPGYYARTPIFPLLVLQGLILFVLGTGQVAGGMTAEDAEGSVDYQRLAPVTPMAKTLGYLLGLPVREYVLFAATLPCTAWCLWKAQVPWQSWLPVYAVFMSAVLLYHLTGLVSGTVLKNRRWAFLLSMGLVFVLYTVVPQGARFGFPFVRYLTLWPVLLEHSAQMSPAGASALMLSTGMEKAGTVPFFQFNVPDLLFTFMVQGSFILTMLVMVWRKWKRVESHLLSRIWGLGIFLWVNILLIGNALPLADDGSLFPTQGAKRSMEQAMEDAGALGLPRAQRLPNFPAPLPAEAAGMAFIFGVNLLLFAVLLTIMMTPSAESQQRGLQRALRTGKSRVPWYSDAAPALPVVLMLAFAGSAAWLIFERGVAGSHWFSGLDLVSWRAVWRFPMALGLSILLFHAALESRGGRVLFVVSVLAGLLPLMAGLIIMASQREIPVSVIHAAGISPLAEMLYATLLSMPESLVPAGPLREAMATASLRWTLVMGALLLWHWAHLRRHWKKRRSELKAAA